MSNHEPVPPGHVDPLLNSTDTGGPRNVRRAARARDIEATGDEIIRNLIDEIGEEMAGRVMDRLAAGGVWLGRERDVPPWMEFCASFEGVDCFRLIPTEERDET